MPLIAIEGIDGAGKTTVIARLAELIRDRTGVVPMVLNDFASVVSRQIKPLMVNEPNVDAQYSLVLAARILTARTIVEPALIEGRIVLFDRYFESTLAYQGTLGVDRTRILDDHVECALPYADLVLLLDLPVSVARARKGKPTDRLEAMTDSGFEVIRDAFQRGAEGSPIHRIINATAPAAELVAGWCYDAIEEAGFMPDLLNDVLHHEPHTQQAQSA
jgi:dTMP kinase